MPDDCFWFQVIGLAHDLCPPVFSQEPGCSSELLAQAARDSVRAA